MPRLKKKYPVTAVPGPVPVVPTTAPSVESAPCKDFMNLEEAAAFFGVSYWTIYALVNPRKSKTGKSPLPLIKAKRIGKYDIVRRADLVKYWEAAA